MAKSVLAGLDPQAYARNALHDPACRWPETNCYVDLWIEVLHAAGFDPAAVLGFTVAQDFEGDQFTFFKMPTADIATLYGIDVQELAIFDRLEAHVVEQSARGRLCLVEVDAFFLPDTRGVSYHQAHSKTTIGINLIDPAERRLHYFHNAGYFALDGEDYDSLFRPDQAGGLPLFPYTEFAKFGFGTPAPSSLETAKALLTHHLARRPQGNPLRAYALRFQDHAADLAGRPPEWFHTYAFNTLRQVGANFELLGSHLGWLAEHGERGLDGAKAAAESIAETAKVMQFKLARAMARKKFDGLTEMIEAMALAYDEAIGTLARHYGHGAQASVAA